MSKRVILVPDPITFFDPFTGAPKGETMDFGGFLLCLMSNPLWVESYSSAKAQDNIIKAYAESVAHKRNVMTISEEDCCFLERAVREPRVLHIGALGPQILFGFGKHPTMARQFLPFQEAVIQSTAE